LSKQYFFVELLSGFLVAGVVSVVFNPLWSLSFSFLISCLWIFVFELLLLMTLIDIRLQIIPNEVVVLLVVLGVVLGFFLRFQFGLFGNSLFGPYAGIFGGQDSLIFNRTIGALSGFLLFLFLFFVTRGRGMGLGDVKLVFALGIVFGWPDVLLISTIAFIIGACFGLVQIFRGVYRMKSFLPFGPFLAIASFVSFFWGEFLIRTYCSFFGIL
jgi:leader peptidase (prepilin peptidase)/N-methyltransferase